MRTKYGNRSCEWEGRQFDSRAELRRYRELRLLQDVGKIKDLECQPKFTLIHPFKDLEGNKVRGAVYTADFIYTDLGYEGALPIQVVEDVKSSPTRTEAYGLRVKMFKAAVVTGLLPPLWFREVM